MEGFDDIHGTIQASVLLALPAVMIGVVSALYEKTTAQSRARVFVMAVLFIILGSFAGIRLNGLGVPVAQFAIPLAAIFSSAFVGRPRGQMIFGGMMIVLGVMLCGHFAFVVKDTYVGRSDWTDAEGDRLVHAEKWVNEYLEEQSEPDPNEYEPGFLYDGHLVLARYPELRNVYLLVKRDRAAALWHTWITKLYARQPASFGLYYPGGKLAEGAGEIEWRMVTEELMEEP